MNKTLEKWEEKTLDEICNFSRGLTYSKKDEVETSNNIVLRANNIDLISNSLNFDELKYINSEIIIPEDKKVKINSIMICISSGSKSHLGKVAFIDKNYGYAFGGFMGLIIPNDNILPKFLYYMLISPAFKNLIFNLTDGANINNLKYSDLKDFKLNIPPLSEQQRIVGILDEAFENIKKAKQNALQNLNDAKELFESTLKNNCYNSNDDWKTNRADSFFILQRGYDLPVQERKKGKYPLISSNGVSDYINQYKIKAPAVVTGRSGTIGKVHYVNEDFWPLNTSLYIKDFKGNLPKFIYYFLQAMDLQKFSSGTGVPTLNRNYVHEVKISFPTLEEQQKIVAQLDELQEQTKKLEQIYEQKIKDLDELKQSILQKAFNGEL